MLIHRKNHRVFGLCSVFLLLALVWWMAGGCAVDGTRGGREPNANTNLLVARADFDVSPEWKLPVIMGRDFWNMLAHKQGKWETTAQYKNYINTEPMVSESAVRYSLDRALGETNNPLEVGVGGLRGLEEKKGPLVTNVPFEICGIRARPPFRTMLPFRTDVSAYKRWKAQYPNFLGFEAGCEWDNEYIVFLCSKDNGNIDGLQAQFKKDGYAEADIAKSIATIRQVVEESKKGRRQAAAGLKSCYDALRRYCFNDDSRMLFLRSGWCFDHYPLEWGAGGVIMETTNTGPYRHQISMFFARGAARQYRKFWAWYIALCYNGYDSKGQGHTDQTPYYTMVSNTLGKSLGKDYGVSVSLNRRDMYLGYLNGASFVAHEVWPYAYCQLREKTKGPWDKAQEWELSPHGEAMKEWYAFARRHPDRGVAYAPVALAVPFDHGQPQWCAKAFSYFPAMRWDTMIDAFMYTLVPYSQDVKKGQEGCLANSPYGDIYDVLVLDPPSGPVRLKTLADYKVLVLLGKYDFDRKVVKRLKDYVSGGGTLVVNIEQMNAMFTEDFIGLARSGKKAEAKGTVRNRTNGAETKISEPYDYEVVTMRGGRMIWEDESGAPLAALNRYGKGNVVTTLVDWMVPRGNIGEAGDKGVPSAWLQSLWKGRQMPFVKLLMDEIAGEVLPVSVKGDIYRIWCK